MAFNFKLIEHEKSKEAPKISSVFQSTWVNPFNVENKFGLILEGLALFFHSVVPIFYDNIVNGNRET